MRRQISVFLWSGRFPGHVWYYAAFKTNSFREVWTLSSESAFNTLLGLSFRSWVSCESKATRVLQDHGTTMAAHFIDRLK